MLSPTWSVLYLHGNMLTGSVPAAIGDLSALTNLWLKDNQLGGILPKHAGQLGATWRGSALAAPTTSTGCVPAALDTDNGDIADTGLEVCGSGS